MAHNLEELKCLLREHSEVYVHHVKRKANQLADALENHGVNTGRELHQVLWEDLREETLRQN